MNAWALCRWMGSPRPGGYTTVIISASLPGMSGSSFVISGVTSACCAVSRPPAAQSKTATSVAIGIFGIRMMPSSGPCGRNGFDGRLVEPVFEADLAEPGIGTRHQTPLVHLGAEVAGLRVGDHFTGVVARAETQSDELVEAELLRSRHLDHAVQRRSQGDPANRIGDI